MADYQPAAAPASLGQPASADETLELLANGRYVADRSLATVLYLALKRQRPLFLEGESGAARRDLRPDDSRVPPKARSRCAGH